MAATSFLSDLGHEAQSVLLPSFIGVLWTVQPALGFGYAAVCMAAGAVAMGLGRHSR